MFLRVIDRLRYRGTDAGVYGVEARELESLLAPAFAPSPGFVQELESRIRAEPMQRVKAETPWWLKRPVQVAALIAVGAIAVVLAWAVTRPPEPRQVSAAVMETAFASLETVDTLRYEVDAWVSPGLCSTVFGAVPTEEEQASLGVDGVILVACGPDHYLERGEYDPDAGPGGGSEFAVTSEKLDGGTLVGSTSELRSVEGTTFVRDWREDGWRSVIPRGRWNPASWSPLALMNGGTYVGLGGLRHVIRDYRDAVDQGIEDFDGMRVRHYAASRSIPGSSYSEEIEVWVGVDDGLPRRAILKTYLEGGTNFESLKARAEEISNDPESDYYRFPVVTRGPEPDPASWAELEYRFFDFDEPLDIKAPVVGD